MIIAYKKKKSSFRLTFRIGGQGWIRTNEPRRERIYSPRALTTCILTQFCLVGRVGFGPTTKRLTEVSSMKILE